MVALRERQYERIVDLAVTIPAQSSDRVAVAAGDGRARGGPALQREHLRGRPPRAAGLRATVEARTPAPLADLPLDTLLQQYVTQHPMSRHYLTTGDRSVLVMGDLLHERDWRRADVYNSTRTLAGFPAHRGRAAGPARGGLRALLFGRPGRDFGDADRALLQRVQPPEHARKAAAVRSSGLGVAVMSKRSADCDSSCGPYRGQPPRPRLPAAPVRTIRRLMPTSA
jgi:hypothetical protein